MLQFSVGLLSLLRSPFLLSSQIIGSSLNGEAHKLLRICRIASEYGCKLDHTTCHIYVYGHSLLSAKSRQGFDGSIFDLEGCT